MNAAVTTELRTDRALDRRGGQPRRVGPHGPGLQPRDGRADGRGQLRLGRGDRSRGRGGEGRVRAAGASGRCPSARSSSSASTSSRRAPRGSRTAPHRRAREGALGRARRGAARHRGDRVRLRDPGAPEGRLLGAGLDRHRRLLDPAAARRRRRHHAVQLPGDGAHVDVGARDRLRERIRAQAVGEGPVRVAPHGRAAEGGRSPGRRLQRRAGRQGRGRRDPRAPGHRRGELRRLHADRPLRLRDGHESRQAHAGARRRQEPHGRAPRRRHRHGRRRGRERRLRLGGRALHGHLGRRRGGRCGRPARRRDQGAPARRSRSGTASTRVRDGAARHSRAPRQGRLLPRLGPGAGRDARRRRPRDGARQRRLLPRRLAPRRRDAGDGRLPRRDLRAGALGRARADATTRRSAS